MKINKKGQILQENIIFIVLNVVFFSVMILFVYLQSSSVHIKEEESAKQIALLIDASRINTTIQVNLGDFFNGAVKNGISKEKSIKIDNDNNLVIARGSEKSFYEYSYFNNVYILYDIEGDYIVLEIK